MVKGIYHYLNEAWKHPDLEEQRRRMIEWRSSDAVVKVEKPLRLDRARMLGYKAKRGIIIVRVRVLRGGHKRPRPRKGRMSRRLHIRKNLKLNYRSICEQKAARKFTNMEVVNSYQVGVDGQHYFYEVIMADRNAPEIKADKQLSYLTKPANANRAFRGLTSAGNKSRGLRNSPFKVPKVRPSLRAHGGRGN